MYYTHTTSHHHYHIHISKVKVWYSINFCIYIFTPFVSTTSVVFCFFQFFFDEKIEFIFKASACLVFNSNIFLSFFFQSYFKVIFCLLINFWISVIGFDFLILAQFITFVIFLDGSFDFFSSASFCRC